METKNLTVITKTYNEGVQVYYVIDNSQIKTLNVSDTYDIFGQEVGPDDAGDSVELLTQIAADYLNTDLSTGLEEEDYVSFKKGDLINAYENREAYFALESLYNNVLADVEEIGVKHLEFYKETCEGFNYFDGNNYKTVVLSYEHAGNNNYEYAPEEIANSILAEIDSMEFESEGFGLKKYRSENFEYTVSQFAGSFEIYSVMSIEDADYKKEMEAGNGYND